MDWNRAAIFYDWRLPLERLAIAAAVALAEPRSDEDLPESALEQARFSASSRVALTGRASNRC